MERILKDLTSIEKMIADFHKDAIHLSKQIQIDQEIYQDLEKTFGSTKQEQIRIAKNKIAEGVAQLEEIIHDLLVQSEAFLQKIKSLQ